MNGHGHSHHHHAEYDGPAPRSGRAGGGFMDRSPGRRPGPGGGGHGGPEGPSTSGADSLPAAEMPALLRRGKLVLVLELDHVLTNSARFTEVTADLEQLLQRRVSDEAALVHEMAPELFRLDRLGLWVKLRPGVREFLRRANEKFELWLRSAGSRAHAEAVVELLDPRGVYFGGRVIAQGGAGTGPAGGAAHECGSDAAAVHAKRLLAGLEAREPVAVLLDDSSAAWPHDRRNLFAVERYGYFPASRRKFGMAGRALLEVNRDECPERGMLMNASHVLDRIHSVVFMYLQQQQQHASLPDSALQPWDVRNVMDEERSKVLSGCHLVFSRIIPMEQDPRTHALWRIAEQFGATCALQCSEATTHVVATTRGTEKTFWAMQHNRHVVATSWLECSCILWRRALEDRFTVPHAR